MLGTIIPRLVRHLLLEQRPFSVQMLWGNYESSALIELHMYVHTYVHITTTQMYVGQYPSSIPYKKAGTNKICYLVKTVAVLQQQAQANPTVHTVPHHSFGLTLVGHVTYTYMSLGAHVSTT